MTIFENENLTIDVKDDIVKLDTRIKLPGFWEIVKNKLRRNREMYTEIVIDRNRLLKIISKGKFNSFDELRKKTKEEIEAEVLPFNEAKDKIENLSSDLTKDFYSLDEKYGNVGKILKMIIRKRLYGSELTQTRENLEKLIRKELLTVNLLKKN